MYAKHCIAPHTTTYYPVATLVVNDDQLCSANDHTVQRSSEMAVLQW